MDQEFLLKFLEIGVIDLSGDDGKLAKLRATAKDLSAALRKTPAMTARFTMVAADPSIASTDPTVEEAMVSLRKQWETVSNTYRSTPVAILRAVLLDAIVQAARVDDAIAVAFVNSARNALAHCQVSDEATIWREAVSEIETKVDTRAESEWATPEMISVAPLKFAPPSQDVSDDEVPFVDRAAMQPKILSAAGPWGGQNQNRYMAHAQPQEWAQDFAARMTIVIAEAVDGMATHLAPAPVDFDAPLSTLADAVSAHVDKALASFSAATAGLQRRTNLLWWKEAMYSPSAHESYLDLPLFDAAALMALDLHEQVPMFSPASVSALLRQTIGSLPVDADAHGIGRREFASLVQDAATTSTMEPFRSLAEAYAPAPTGRGPLLSLIGHPREVRGIDNTALRAYAGVDASTEMTPSEWGTYLFRELQAARATSPAKRPKKK